MPPSSLAGPGGLISTGQAAVASMVAMLQFWGYQGACCGALLQCRIILLPMHCWVLKSCIHLVEACISRCVFGSCCCCCCCCCCFFFLLLLLLVLLAYCTAAAVVCFVFAAAVFAAHFHCQQRPCRDEVGPCSGNETVGHQWVFF